MLNIKIFPYLTYMSRDQFINDIKKWVAIDNEIKKIMKILEF